jgi:hypothetical protein
MRQCQAAAVEHAGVAPGLNVPRKSCVLALPYATMA